ncbi:hypothetical protein ACMZ4X_04225 [Achromobacter marplatensis]
MTGDRHGQCGGRGGTIRVRDGVGDRSRGGLAAVQELEVRTRIERVRAVGVQGKRTAMGTGDRLADAGVVVIDLRDLDGVAVGIAVVGQHAVLGVDVEGGFLIGRAGVGRGDRSGVIDVPFECLGDRGASRVLRRDDNGVDALVAALRGRRVEFARDQAGDGVKGQARREASGAIRQRVALVGVLELLGDIDRSDGVAIVVGQIAERDARGQDRGVVGAGDRDGQRGGIRRALRIGHRVDDRCGRRLARGQFLERRAGVERVGAVGVQRKRAPIAASHGCAHVGCGTGDRRDAQAVVIRVSVVAKHAFGAMLDHQRVVFRRGAAVIGRNRRGVTHVPDEGLGDRRAGLVGGRHRDEVFALHARIGVVRRPVGERAGERAGGGIEHQTAGNMVDGVGQDIVVVQVAECAGDVVGDGIAIHVALVLQRDRGGSVIRARYLDRQRGDAGATFTVRDRIGNVAGRRLAGGQVLEANTRIERIGAVGIQGERAAAYARDRFAHVAGNAVDGGHNQRVAVRITVVGQHAGAGIRDIQDRVFVRLAGIVNGYGGRVRDVPGEILRHRGAALVRSGDGDGVDPVVSALRSGMVQGAGNDAGDRVDGQARGQPVGLVREGVVIVGVGELAGDVDRGDGLRVGAVLVFQGDARGQDRGVIGAGDRDSQAGRAGAAFAVRDRVGDGTGGRLARAQRVERGARVERIGSVGVQGERAAMRTGYGGAYVGGDAVNLRDGQRIAIRILVVGQHPVLGSDGQRRVFAGRTSIVIGRGRGIGHVPVERLGGRRTGGVRGGDGDGVDAVFSALRRGMVNGAADDSGDRVDAQPRRKAGRGVGQLVAGVLIREVAGDVVAHFRLGVDAGGVRNDGRDRTVISPRDRDDNSRRGGGAAWVRDGVRDRAGGRLALGQVVILPARREDVAAIWLDGERAAIAADDGDAARGHGTAADRSDRQRVAVGIGIVVEQVAADQAVLVAAACVVQGIGRVVDGGGRGRVVVVVAQAGAGHTGQRVVGAGRVRVGQIQRRRRFQDAGQADKAAAAGITAAGHDGGGRVQFVERVAAGLQRSQQAVGVGAGGRDHGGFAGVGQRTAHVAIDGDFAAFTDDDRHAVFNLKGNRGARGSDDVATGRDFAALMQFGQGTVAIAYPRATRDFIDDCGGGVGHVGSDSGSYPRWPDTRGRRWGGILSSRTVSRRNFAPRVGRRGNAVNEQGQLQAVGHLQFFENG